jgi:hypothetical protein
VAGGGGVTNIDDVGVGELGIEVYLDETKIKL